MRSCGICVDVSFSHVSRNTFAGQCGANQVLSLKGSHGADETSRVGRGWIPSGEYGESARVESAGSVWTLRPFGCSNSSVKPANSLLGLFLLAANFQVGLRGAEENVVLRFPDSQAPAPPSAWSLDTKSRLTQASRGFAPGSKPLPRKRNT